jgi:hypothetical protein
MASSSNVKLRDDLVVSEQKSGGRTAFVVKDATASRFFRLSEVEPREPGLQGAAATSEKVGPVSFRRIVLTSMMARNATPCVPDTPSPSSA